MRRRRRKRTLPPPLPADDPMVVVMEQYLLWMQTQNYSEDTVSTRRACLGYFIHWCRERGLGELTEITRPVLERYQRWLYQLRKPNGEPLAFRTQNQRLHAIKGFFRWLARRNYLLHNPASELELPHLENRLPKYVLNVEEAERVLAVPDIASAEGLRDRAMLETFYATGMRRMEVARLKLYDIDADRGTVMVRLGKGKKDRVIPISERALAWIRKYLEDARPRLLAGADDGTLFLTELGEPFIRYQLTALVRRYLARADIGKMGGCHLFRHTMATLMLENGADIRVIQEMLGHAKLATTELYTRVSINLLKQVYAATHPAANLKGQRAEEAAELFAALAAEAGEDPEEV